MGSGVNSWDLIIGRAGAQPRVNQGDTPLWPTLEVTDATWQGDTVTFTGSIAREPSDTTFAVNNWKMVRRQLLGLLEPEQPWVPVRWASDSTHDGFYAVEDVTVGASRVALAEGAGPFTVRLRRLGATFQRPVVQLRQRLVLMPNDHGIVAVTHVAGGNIGLPGSADEVSTRTAMVSVISDDASATVWAGQALWASSAETVKQVDVGCATAPARYYDGACSVRVPHGTAGWYWALTGRQLDTSITAATISNGLVSATPVSGGAGGISLTWTNDGLTFATRVVEAVVGGASITGVLKSISIVRNTPELAIMRTGWQAAGAPSASVPSYVVDIAVARGSKMVRFYVSDLINPASISRLWAMRLQTPAACAALPLGAITAGAMSTSAAADRVILCCPKTHTQDLVNGAMTYTASQPFGLFGVGGIQGLTSATPFTQTEIAADYYSPVACRTVLVGR